MKLLRYCLLVGYFLWSCAGVSAKDNKDLIRANYYYAHYAYFEAIPYFEKVAEQLKDPVIYSQLADCYSITGSLQKAADAYASAAALPGCNPVVILRYANVLMQLMQYDDAEKWLKVYLDKNKTDQRATNLLAGCATAKKIAGEIPAGTVTLLPFNTDGSDFGPARWKDKIVFASDTAMDIKKKTDSWTGRSYYNMYGITCDNSGQCGNEFEKVAEAKGMNIKYHDGPGTFSADGKTMYFTRSRYNDKFFGKKAISGKDSTVLLEIMIATDFDTASKKFKTITPFQHNSADYAVAHPSVSPNGKMLVFSSNMPKGQGGSDLYVCMKLNKTWSKPVNLGKNVNTEGEEVFPCWADDATLCFSSDGHEGLGGLDIYKCKWDEASKTCTGVENAGIPINSSYDDISLTMYADDRSTYLSSNRPAAKSGDNVYFYRKEKLFLQLTVLDSLTGQPIVGADITIDAPKDRKNVNADSKGQYFTRLYPQAQYGVGVSSTGYGSAHISLQATSTKETDTLYRTVKLLKPLPPPRDTMPQLETAVPKRKNVMDTPGIRVFEKGEIYELGHFYYDYDKYDLKVAHKLILDTLMTQLNRHPTMCIEIRAHTDCRGSFEYNKVLSENRAKSVVNYLVEHGISRKRLEYVGLGFSMPTIRCPDCLSCTEEQHYINRILEFKVLKL